MEIVNFNPVGELGNWQGFYTIDKIPSLAEYEKEKDFKAVIDGVTELDKIYSGIHNGELDAATLQKLHATLAAVRAKVVN